MSKCFYCEKDLDGSELGLSDGCNAYWFCDDECVSDFIETTTYNKDGSYTIYTSI